MTQAEATILIGSLIVIAIIGLGMLTIGLVFAKRWALFAAGLVFLGLTFLAYMESANWEIAELFQWLGIGLFFACIFAAIIQIREMRSPKEPELPPDEVYEKELEGQSDEYRERRRKRMENQL